MGGSFFCVLLKHPADAQQSHNYNEKKKEPEDGSLIWIIIPDFALLCSTEIRKTDCNQNSKDQ